MKKLVVLSGAGISAESGIRTFRDSNGLWEGHDVMEVASPEGWYKNPELVLTFYNQRRKQALTVEPNKAHYTLADLENYFDVHIITQNVDDLHERAGSTNVIHLHGELFKACSEKNVEQQYPIDGWALNIGDLAPDGHQLRPAIVWFGEAVPLFEKAIECVSDADLLVVVGTSMVVYPAASLIDYVPHTAQKYIVDPNSPEIRNRPNLHFVQEKATVGVVKVAKQLISHL